MLNRTSNRVGKVVLTTEAFNNDALRGLLFVYFHPMNAEHDMYRQVIEYTGICDYFEEVDRGSIVPTYSVELGTHANGPTSIKFIKE